MKAPRNLALTALTAMLASCLLAYYSTRDAATPLSRHSASTLPLVDRSLLDTAIELAPSAATAEERERVFEAWFLAHEEVDLAFGMVLRQPGDTSSVNATSYSRHLNDNITRLKARIAAEKTHVEGLGKDASASTLVPVQAQLAADQDELNRTQQELDHQARQWLIMFQTSHESFHKESEQNMKFGTLGATETLIDQFREMFTLGGYLRQLKAARLQAIDHAKVLLAEHNFLERPDAPRDASVFGVAALRQLADRQKTLADLNQRADYANQLMHVYQSWGALVENRQRAVLRLLLRSLAAIIVILLVTLLLNIAMSHTLRLFDRPQLAQVPVVARTLLRALAVLLVLLVVFGLPAQLSALIGIVTALMPLFRTRVKKSEEALGERPLWAP